MKHIMTGTVMLAFSAFAADVNVQWTKGGTPETLGDGAVSLTYDAGLVKSATVTAEDGGKVTMSGDAIGFAANPFVKFAEPGTMAFANPAEVKSGALTLGEPKAGEDFLRFEAAPTEVVSYSTNNPTLLFAGKNLSDYEPAYAHFQTHNPGGSKWWVARELENELLRPYHVVRANEGGVETLTVQFQGVTRLHEDPHTASLTVKFLQQGADIAAYVVRAAALKPLDVELGLDMDALVDAGDPRAEGKTLKVSEPGNYSISVVAMRRAHDNSHTVAFEKALPEATAVAVANDVALETSGDVDSPTFNGYLPANSWTTVAKNHKVTDLVKVEGFFHYRVAGQVRSNEWQTAYNLKKSETYTNVHTVQFQRPVGTDGTVACLIVMFTQSGNDVKAKSLGDKSFYITPTNGIRSLVYLGMDFEKHTNAPGDPVHRSCYNSYATSDDSNAQGIKDFRLTFASDATLQTQGADVTVKTSDAVATKLGGKKTGSGNLNVTRTEATPTYEHEGYLKNATWTLVAENRRLSDLERVDGTFHYGNNVGFSTQTAYNLKHSDLDSRIGEMSCQFQTMNAKNDTLYCLLVRFRQNGGNVEMYADGFCSYYVQHSDTPALADQIVPGLDCEVLTSKTQPKRNTYGADKETGKYIIGEADDSKKQGVKDMKFFFKEKSDTLTYALADTTPAVSDVMLAGTAEAPLKVKTTAGALFPSNGVITVGPYADLNIRADHKDDKWTKYVVCSNGTLRLNASNCLNRNGDAIDLLGGTLKLRDEAAATVTSSGVYVNYLTLANGAEVSGKPVHVGHSGQTANWLVTGETPSTCHADILQLAAGSGIARTFRFYVNDVTGDAATDFLLKGGITDYATFTKDPKDYWNCFLVKGGEGTMEVEGDITIPNDIDVKAGVLKLTKSDPLKVSYHNEATGLRTAITLSGGALALADGITVAPGVFAATNGTSQVVLGAGATLNVPALSVTPGARLDIAAAAAAVLHSDAPLAPGVRRRLTLNGGKAMLDENGNLVSGSMGIVFIVR